MRFTFLFRVGLAQLFVGVALSESPVFGLSQIIFCLGGGDRNNFLLSSRGRWLFWLTPGFHSFLLKLHFRSSWVCAVVKYQIWCFDPWCVKFDTGVTEAIPAVTPG